MPLSAYAQKAALDWVLLGATPTRPAQVWVGISLGSPTSTSASENGASSGYTRITFIAGAATSPGGSASNATAVAFASFSASGNTASGFQLWDTQGVGAGNMLWYGLLSAATSVNPGSQFTAAIGSCFLSAL